MPQCSYSRDQILALAPVVRSGANARGAARDPTRPVSTWLSRLSIAVVEVLFGTQLEGGTDINRALAHCQSLIRRPGDAIMAMITDLYQGGDNQEMRRGAAPIAASGTKVVCLLAISDEGAPMYDHKNASAFASFGIPTFACTPDLFPDMMACALQRGDLDHWAARMDIVSQRAAQDRV